MSLTMREKGGAWPLKYCERGERREERGERGEERGERREERVVDGECVSEGVRQSRQAE